MTIYIVQILDWDWGNDAVFKDKNDAKKYIIERFKELYPVEAEDERIMADITKSLEEDSYIEEFAAIETWEVK